MELETEEVLEADDTDAAAEAAWADVEAAAAAGDWAAIGLDPPKPTEAAGGFVAATVDDFLTR